MRVTYIVVLQLQTECSHSQLQSGSNADNTASANTSLLQLCSLSQEGIFYMRCGWSQLLEGPDQMSLVPRRIGVWRAASQSVQVMKRAADSSARYYSKIILYASEMFISQR